MIKTLLELSSVWLRAILFRMGFAVKPYKVCWLITWRCNLSCNYCEIGQSDMTALAQQEMTLDEAKRTADDLKRTGIKFITFAGGEPLMYRDVYALIRYCKELGFVVGIVTNGNLVTEAIARQLAESGVDHVHISLDSPDKTQDLIRHREGCFERVHAAFANLKKFKNINNYHLGVACVVSGFNYRNLENIFMYAEQNGLDSVALQPFFVNQIRSQEMRNDFGVTPDKVPQLLADIKRLFVKYRHLIRNSSFYTEGVAKYFADNKMKGTSCYGGCLTINIFPDGTLGPCYYLQGKDTGSVRAQSMMEIVRSEGYRGLLKRVRKRDCPTCWCAVVHEYNLFFKPREILRSLRLVKVARNGR